MSSYSYRLLNVFAESTFGGNPLCVFENAQGLTDQQMQSLALQFNLSETTFIFPSEVASARMRIFTPSFEMPFAGHPTLGTSYVVRDLLQTGDTLSLECKAGVIPVQAHADVLTFTAPSSGVPIVAPCRLNRGQIAALLGLAESDLASDPIWVNTGSDQLLVPVASVDAVRRARPDGSQLANWPISSQNRTMAYVFTLDESQTDSLGRIPATSRFFFTKQGNFLEDPGTGSACANLGGWWIATGRQIPAHLHIIQGQQIQRPSHLLLDVMQDLSIRVGGRVVELGRGQIQLPAPL